MSQIKLRDLDLFSVLSTIELEIKKVGTRLRQINRKSTMSLIQKNAQALETITITQLLLSGVRGKKTQNCLEKRRSDIL